MRWDLCCLVVVAAIPVLLVLLLLLLVVVIVWLPLAVFLVLKCALRPWSLHLHGNCKIPKGAKYQSAVKKTRSKSGKVCVYLPHWLNQRMFCWIVVVGGLK